MPQCCSMLSCCNDKNAANVMGRKCITDWWRAAQLMSDHNISRPLYGLFVHTLLLQKGRDHMLTFSGLLTSYTTLCAALHIKARMVSLLPLKHMECTSILAASAKSVAPRLLATFCQICSVQKLCLHDLCMTQHTVFSKEVCCVVLSKVMQNVVVQPAMPH